MVSKMARELLINVKLTLSHFKKASIVVAT